MSSVSSGIIILVVVAFACFLIYNQTNQQKNLNNDLSSFKQQALTAHQPTFDRTGTADPYQLHATTSSVPSPPSRPGSPTNVNITLDPAADPYSDPVKKQDLYSMYDPLTYPQLRLPREVLEKYNEYYEKNGSYPPFNQHTQPLFDNPILNGILIKQVDDNEPFSDSVPHSIPLFRVKSSKNINRFFYYVVDQRYSSKIELKIPLDHIKVNGIRYNNADFYGLPEIYDGDIIEHIPIYPSSKFKVLLYRTYSFP